MKRILLVFLLCIAPLAIAQNFENLWEDYFSYVSVKDISQGDDRIFVGTDNAIFHLRSYLQKKSQLYQVFKGLAGEPITTIHYSSQTNLLMIGYQDGLIEVVTIGQENEVLKVVDIRDKQNIPPNKKRINHFTERDGKIYISAAVWGLCL